MNNDMTILPSAQPFLSTLFQIINIFIAPIYVILTITSILSLCEISILQELSSHGKTFTNTQSSLSLSSNSTSSLLWIESILNYLLKKEVSKQNFIHFYLIGICCTMILVSFFIFNTSTWEILPSPTATTAVGVLFLFIHLSRRCYECVYIHKYTEDSSKMYSAGYMLGLLHYAILPLVFLLPTNGNTTISKISTSDHFPNATNDKNGVIIILLLALLNIVGQMEQYKHHQILSKIRFSRSSTNIKKEYYINNYQIPRGRLFHYVSCPHYLAEIIVYISFVGILHYSTNTTSYTSLPTMMNNSSLLSSSYYYMIHNNKFLLKMAWYKHIYLLIWVITNLAVSANRNHNWYNSTFGDRFKVLGRKRLIPFVW